MILDEKLDLIDYKMIIHNKSLAEVVENYIQDMIIRGIYKNGNRLVESDIAEKLNISRGPVRDALKILEQKGVVDLEPRKGARVCNFTTKDFIEIMEIRLLIESSIIESLIEKKVLSKEDFSSLKVIVDKMVEAVKSNISHQEKLLLVNKYGITFHQYIWEKSKSKRRKNILNSMYFQLKLAMQYKINMENDILQYSLKYYDILSNLENGDIKGYSKELRKLSVLT